jgi:hypothetical protein
VEIAPEFLDPVVRRASVVEDRTWRRGIEIISHVNYDQLARVRVALGVMPDACGRTLDPEALRQRQPPIPVAAASQRIVLWDDIMAQIIRLEEPHPPLKLLRSA